MPPPRTPWRLAPLCVLDLETTGLDRPDDEIVAFATMPIDGGRARVAGVRSRLVRPRRMPGPETIRIHGLRREDLVGAPPLSEMLDELLVALAGRRSSPTSRRSRSGSCAGRCSGRDPVPKPGDRHPRPRGRVRSRRGEARPESVRLTPLARELGLPVHRPHDAAGDVLTTAQVFLALVTHLEAIEPQTVGSLCELRHRDDPLPRIRRTLRRLRGR